MLSSRVAVASSPWVSHPAMSPAPTMTAEPDGGGGGGGAETVMAAVPTLPSLVAEIVAVPAVTPVTRPLLLTVATETLLDVQVTGRSTGLPWVSFGVALSCTVLPTSTVA